MRLKSILLGFALAMLAGGASLAAEYELKLSSMFPPTHFINTVALEPWVKSIEETSKGRVRITLFAGGSALGDATKQFDQVRSGVVDLAVGKSKYPDLLPAAEDVNAIPFDWNIEDSNDAIEKFRNKARAVGIGQK